MSTITKQIDVAQPIRTVYDQWTQFEAFPQFMEGVEQVRQLDDRRLEWKVELGGAEREFSAEISDQIPDQLVAWRAVGDTGHSGRVTFDKVDEESTRVHLEMEYEPEGFAEKAGDKLGIVERRVSGDHQRFKDYI